MPQNPGKQIFQIYCSIMQDASYRTLSSEFREKLDALQALSATLSAEQWKAIHEYIDIASRVHQAMMEIALQTPPCE